jgi:hypothetical protein
MEKPPAGSDPPGHIASTVSGYSRSISAREEKVYPDYDSVLQGNLLSNFIKS